MKDNITATAIVAAISIIGTVVGGVQYVDHSIASAERRAIAKAEKEIAKRDRHNAELYARREDVLRIEARLDQVLELQRTILLQQRQRKNH